MYISYPVSLCVTVIDLIGNFFTLGMLKNFPHMNVWFRKGFIGMLYFSKLGDTCTLKLKIGNLSVINASVRESNC